MEKIWEDNAFWDNEERTRVKAILTLTTSDGVETSQVLAVNKHDDEGNENPDWTELMDQLGSDLITSNTEERVARKEREAQEKIVHEEQRKKAHELEKLFNAKLQAFEIEEVKQSKNRGLKTRLRRAKTIIEVNIYAMMIVMEQIENESAE